MTLADQCFAHEEAGMEVFSKVNEILGCALKGCSAPDFKWGCYDTAYDSYDSSIEVIRPEGSPFMTREQADEILALGFSCIFESCGELAQRWNKDGVYKCNSRPPDEISRLKAQISDLRAKLC